MDELTRIEELIEMLTPEELAELIKELKERRNDRKEREKHAEANDDAG